MRQQRVIIGQGDDLQTFVRVHREQGLLIGHQVIGACRESRPENWTVWGSCGTT